MSFTLQEQGLRSLFTSCADVQLQTHEYGTEPHVEKVVFIFCTGAVRAHKPIIFNGGHFYEDIRAAVVECARRFRFFNS